ncbi:MAG: ClpXP protease specificity-enhancing factor [Betaproteobacteria bacterium]|nr:ClpXP protease specificity-enhancing factor [Betaproteobacteria bacterium]
MAIASTKPYLLRAIHEWCVDQGFTPHIAVTVDAATVVPRHYVKDGQIVLNVGPEAAHQLVMGNETITFMARFNGVAHSLSVPVSAVGAIYARENGHGMAFEVVGAESPEGAEDASAEQGVEAGDESPEPTPHGGRRPRLTVIK